MGSFDHLLGCKDGDKDTPFLVPLAGWEPQKGEGSGRLDDGNYEFKIASAEIVTKGEGAKTPGKNLHLTLTTSGPAGFAGVSINQWHGLPVGEPMGIDGAVNEGYRLDLVRLQSIVASIKSGTPGAVEAATAEGAQPIKITARALEGRTVYARTRLRTWQDRKGIERESSEVYFYVSRAEFDAAPGPAAGGKQAARAPVAQTSVPEVAGAPLGGAAPLASAAAGNGTQPALDRALGL